MIKLFFALLVIVALTQAAWIAQHTNPKPSVTYHESYIEDSLQYNLVTHKYDHHVIWYTDKAAQDVLVQFIKQNPDYKCVSESN